MTITTNYQKNKAVVNDFFHVVTLATRRKKVRIERIFYTALGVLGLWAAVVLFFVGEDIAEYTMAVLGTLAGIHFFLRGVFYYQYAGLFSRRRMIKEMDEIKYTFAEECVMVDSSLEHCESPYHVFQGIYESKRIFVLLLTQRIGYIIAKEDLSEEELSELRAILKAKFEVPLIYYDV